MYLLQAQPLKTTTYKPEPQGQDDQQSDHANASAPDREPSGDEGQQPEHESEGAWDSHRMCSSWPTRHLS